MHGDIKLFFSVLVWYGGSAFDGVIGVLPGEGEALAQFDLVFLTQFHWELL